MHTFLVMQWMGVVRKGSTVLFPDLREHSVFTPVFTVGSSHVWAFQSEVYGQQVFRTAVNARVFVDDSGV